MINFEQVESVGNAADFPFSFDPNFAEVFCQEHRRTFVLIKFSGDCKGFVPISISESRLLCTAQFLFSPLDESANLLAPELERTVLESVSKFLKREYGIHRIIQGVNWALFQSYPSKAKWCDFGSYRLNLSGQNAESILNGMHSKHRNVIKNAAKNKVVVHMGKNELPNFFKLYTETMSRNNMYSESFQFFEKLMDSSHDSICCAVVYSNNRPEGAVFMPFSNFGAYYVYGCSAENIQITGAVNYLHFELMQYLIQRQVRLYDFVGARLTVEANSKLEGIQRFKSRFGSTLVTGYLWKMDLVPWRCWIYDTALWTKFALRGKKLYRDIIDAENKR